MFNKREDEIVRERKSGGVTGRIACPLSSSDITSRKFYTNANRKAEEFSDGVKRLAKDDVSMNEPKRNGAKSTVSSAVWRVRVPVQETACVSGKGSTVYKHTASSLAKKEARVVPETAKATQTAKIGKQVDTPVKKTEAKTVSSQSQKVWREKVHPECKELPARKQKSEPPAPFSAKKGQTKPLGGTIKQPTKIISPSPPLKPKKFKEVPRKLLLPKDQTSRAKRIQGKQPEHEASTSESDSDSNCNSDCGNHIEWNGFDEPDNEIGVYCCLCERDMGVEPSQDDKSEQSLTTLRVAAILPCGHAFHVDCLYNDELELKPGGEPSCIICESTLT